MYVSVIGFPICLHLQLLISLLGVQRVLKTDGVDYFTNLG